MTKTTPSKVSLTSSDLLAERQEILRASFPEIFSEGKIDWDKLKVALDGAVDFDKERFGFTWKGKVAAIQNVLVPSKATLRPAKDESVNFDTSENLFIEGDNLEVLKLLQKAYFEKVKMIYIDPPYNTGNDFVYRDDFKTPLKNYLEQTGQVDAEGNKLQANRETSGRFHSDWLSMMYPRLKLAWNLLRDNGVIFVSIDDHESHHLRILMDEVFGEENFVATISRRTKVGGGSAAKWVAVEHDYVLVYLKSAEQAEEFYAPYDAEYLKRFKETDETGPYYWDTFERSYTQTKPYKITAPDGEILEGSWFKSEASFKGDLANGEIRFHQKADGDWSVQIKTRPSEGRKIRSLLVDNAFKSSQDDLEKLGLKNNFDFPKPVSLLRELISACTENSDIILDFFAGSGTTAEAVMSQNAEDGFSRKWICVQLPEELSETSEAHKGGFKSIADLAKERIRKAAKTIEAEVSEKRGYYNGLREAQGYGEREIKEVQAGEEGYRYDFDDGFKAFRLTASNYVENQFELDPSKSEEENKVAFTEYLKKANQKGLFEETDGLDVVYENIVKEGFSLNSNVAEEKVGGSSVYKVSDGDRTMFVCLDKQISKEAAKEFGAEAYKDKPFICLDSALDDSGKANLALNVDLKTI